MASEKGGLELSGIMSFETGLWYSPWTSPGQRATGIGITVEYPPKLSSNIEYCSECHPVTSFAPVQPLDLDEVSNCYFVLVVDVALENTLTLRRELKPQPRIHAPTKITDPRATSSPKIRMTGRDRFNEEQAS